MEDELGAAAEAAKLVGRQAEYVATLEGHAPGGRLDQAQHEASDSGLAAAGLAHQRQRLAHAHIEGQAVDGVHNGLWLAEQRSLHHEVLDETIDGEEGGRHATSSASGAFQQRDSRSAAPRWRRG